MNIFKTTIVAASILAAGVSVSAEAAQSKGYYVEARAGVSSFKYDINEFGSDTIFAPSIAAGYQFSCDNIICGRMDVSYTRFNNYKDSYKSGIFESDVEINANTFLMNGYLDIYPTNDLFIYGTAGLGLSTIEREFKVSNNFISQLNSKNSKDDTNFTYQVGAGVGYHFTDNLSLDLGYRFTYLGKVDIDVTTVYADGNYSVEKQEDALYAHTVSLGLAYKF